MGYRLENLPRFSEQEVLKKLNEAAKAYEPFVDQVLSFIFRENKESEYEAYTVRFGKRNFMHLAGIKSRTLDPNAFFDACLMGAATKKDCTPLRNPMTMYAKIDVMAGLFDFKNSKCYKIGDKTVVTIDNEFEFATGNNDGLIGYDHRISIPGSDRVNKNHPAIPTTLLRRPLYEYCSNPQKIMFVIRLSQETEEFDTVVYEIKKGLFLLEKDHIPIRKR